MIKPAASRANRHHVSDPALRKPRAARGAAVPGPAAGYEVLPALKASVVELTVEAIRTEIKMGRLAPGQRLIEGEIGNALGASRASIREALGRLEADGLVEMEHQKGARVRRLSTLDAQNIYQIREALEGFAARLAAQNIGKSDYKARLKALQKDFQSHTDGSPASYLQYNEKFHRLIVEIAENPRLLRLLDQLHHAAFLILVQVVSTPKEARRSHNEHAPIVKAILSGDEDAAEQAMRAHIHRTGDEMVGRIASFLT